MGEISPNTLVLMDILSEIDTFIAAHSLKEGEFGLIALNDKNFVPQLRKGRDIRTSTVAKVRDFMAGYRSEAA